MDKLISIFARLGSLLTDYFISSPVRERGLEAIRRTRLIVGVAWASVFLLTIGSINAYLDGKPFVAHWPLAIAVGIGSVPFIVRTTGSPSLGANLLAGAVAFIIGFGNLARFGAGHSPLIATAIVPLVAVLLGGWRTGLVWGGTSVAQIVILAAAHAGDLQLPAALVLPAELVQGTSRMRASGVLTVILILALVYDALMTRSLRAAAESRDRAERANRAKTEFFASMSHEVRTPISIILGITEMLGDTELDEDQRELVETIERSGTSLLGLANDVLDLSKIEAGRLEIEIVAFDAIALAQQVHVQLEHVAQSKGTGFELIIGEDVPAWVHGDPGRIRQVILNLVSNAIKFTTDGQVVLDIQCEKRDAKEATLRFAVTDTGIGIPADELPRLFERYTQMASTRLESGGTGLGLPISRELAKRMNGSLEATSEPGKGSCFTFTLPLRLAEEPRDTATRARAATA